MKKKYWLFTLCLLLMAALSLTACGQKDTSSSSQEEEETTTESEYTNPFTGEALSSTDELGDYVFMVSIDNSAAAAPQSGLNAADLLMEVPAEGGVCRFLAFYYQNQPDTIGPVRSARHYFYDIVKGYDAIFAHCGGSSMAYDIINSGTVKDIDEMSASSTFWRSSDRKAPHNLYTSYASLSEEAAAKGYDKVSLDDCPSFDFYTTAEQKDLSFGGVTELSIPFTYLPVSYQWDETNKDYVRYANGEVHMDALDNKAVTAENIVVLYIDYTVMSDGDHLDMTFTSGDGLLLQDGTVTKIDWSISDGNGFTFTDAESGNEVKMIPGKTIIEVAKTSQTATYTDTTAEGEAQ